MGHISINCPMKVEQVKMKNKIFQTRAAKYNDQEDEEITKENEDYYE